MPADDDNSLRLAVRVTPRAARDAITGWVRDSTGRPCLKISLTAVADRGRANEALIAFLAREWGMKQAQITLARGAADRHKLLVLRDPPEAVKFIIKDCK